MDKLIQSLRKAIEQGEKEDALSWLQDIENQLDEIKSYRESIDNSATEMRRLLN